MKADEVIAALDLPLSARVDRRVPKSLLIEHGALMAADKRQINDGVEQIQWVASLKPTTVGVEAYRDETREYLEIAVLRLKLRGRAKSARIIELLHRAIPYPVLILTELGDQLNLSGAHKRWAQARDEKMVLDGDAISVGFPSDEPLIENDFRAALALGRQPRASLMTLYQGWLDVLEAFAAAHLSGTFSVLSTTEDRIARREALQQAATLNAEIARLRAAATRERQLSRQVVLNEELKRVESKLHDALASLSRGIQ